MVKHCGSSLYAVIPAGGSGTRLWPASRASKPKFLLPLPGPRSMLQATADRLAPIVPHENMFIVTGSAHAVNVGRQLPSIPDDNIIVEPSPRGTAPAIGLGAAIIAHRDPEAIMGSFAADHYIRDAETFRQAVQVAAEVAKQGNLVTIGITPTYAETGYGYIRSSEEIHHTGTFSARRIEEFKEKPDLETAEAYVASGKYLWNASIFVWRASTLLDEMARLLPDLHSGLIDIAAAWDTSERDQVVNRIWPSLRDVTIDHGIMEHAEQAAVVPASFDWTDLGDWHSLAETLGTTAGKNVVIGAPHVAEDTNSTLIFGNRRTIATLGVENLVIVDTDDVILICSRSRAQDVRKLVQKLKDDGDSVLL